MDDPAIIQLDPDACFASEAVRHEPVHPNAFKWQPGSGRYDEKTTQKYKESGRDEPKEAGFQALDAARLEFPLGKSLKPSLLITFKNTSTTLGSNWVPLFLEISSRASSNVERSR